MQFGSLEVSQSNGMFTLTFNGRGLGAGNDLKSFTETRIKSGMTSAELLRSLEQLHSAGESEGWDFEKMSKLQPAKSA